MNMTINEHVEAQRRQFRALSASHRRKLAREARGFIYQHPGCADHSNYWRGLSARQVIEANHSKS